MITIDDIAQRAGVSNTTVSNVIHGRTSRVSAETINRINRIIEETGYVPNMSARALASRSSKVVALVSHLDPEKSGSFLEDPFHNTFIGAVEKGMRKKGYYLMVRTIATAEDLSSFLRNWNVDGLFLTGVFEGEDIHTALKKLQMPVVLSDSYLHDYGSLVNIGLQDFEGGRLATEHLIEFGHRRIAFVGPPILGMGVVQQRLDGYKTALNDAGIPFDKSLVFEQEFSTTEAAALGARLAKQQDITALFASADILAAGIMSGLQQNGRKVPDDFSVIGFDDINWCRMTNPMLSTVHQDAVQKGRLAASCMIQMLEGEKVAEKNTVLPVSLVSRNSVAAPPKQ